MEGTGIIEEDIFFCIAWVSNCSVQFVVACNHWSFLMFQGSLSRKRKLFTGAPTLRQITNDCKLQQMETFTLHPCKIFDMLMVIEECVHRLWAILSVNQQAAI